MADNRDLFRKESLDSIASPEQMNDYIKVIGPSIWIMLGAVIIFLLGIIIWGIFGRLETTDRTVAFVDKGIAVCYVDQDAAQEINRSSELRIGGEEVDIRSVSGIPVQASGVYDEKTLRDLGFSEFQMIYAVTANSSLPDGSYSSELIVEEIHPMSFVTGETE